MIERSSETALIIELQKPLKTTIEEIIKDTYKIMKEFPVDSIPHVTESNEIKDNIHPMKSKAKGNIALDQAKPNLKYEDISNSLKEVFFCFKSIRLLLMILLG
jgi:hypothetical protein